jgi:hypothetical protein
MLKEILINPIDNFIKEENDKKYIIVCDIHQQSDMQTCGI